MKGFSSEILAETIFLPWKLCAKTVTLPAEKEPLQIFVVISQVEQCSAIFKFEFSHIIIPLKEKIEKWRKETMKNKFVILSVALLALLAISAIPLPAQAAVTYGPRMDEVLIKIYGSDTAEFAAFEAQEIDLVDWPLTPTEISKWSGLPYSEYIAFDPYREIGMWEVDINNNLTMPSYPNWPSPTSYVAFRRAIAYMVDKPYIISTIVGGYGAQMETPIMPWLRWYDTTIVPYTYDPAIACQILFDNGWRDSPDPDNTADVHFPPGHPLAGQPLKNVMTNGPSGAADPGLIFYIRSDHSLRQQAGILITDGDLTHKGLEAIGIPVDLQNVPRSVSSPKVMFQKDFHLYMGGWSLSRDPDYLYDLWNSDQMNWDITEFAWNYNNIQDALFDQYTAALKRPATLEEAEINAKLAQQRFVDQAFFIPIWTTLGYMAHNKVLHVLNVDSFGVRNWWNIFAVNKPSVGVTGGQLRWGFMHDPEALNVIYSEWVWDWQVLDKIYDGMLAMNPLNIAVDMPWMASSWTVGTWTNPDNGQIASKVSYTLKTGIKWVNSTNGVILGDVTPEDVRFSFQYVYDHVGWNYPSAADLYVNPDGSLKIEIVGNTITFYESVLSVWALHWVGGLPIIPKFLFQTIADPHGYTPGNLGIKETMIGSGSHYFSGYNVGVSMLLLANRNYFMPIVPNTDTNPTYIKIDWGIFKGNVRSGDWTVNVLDLIVVAGQIGWIGPPGDIPADINKDGKVNVLDLIIVATNLGASW